MRIILHPAFVLHTRPYRETSLLVDFFTQEYGRITAVAKGVRQSRSQWRPLLQPFRPLLISWQGKTELMTLVTVEPNGPSSRFQGETLLSGLYLNELLVRVLQKQDPHADLFAIYHATLLDLHSAHSPLKALRLFEKKLLEKLGYGLQLHHNNAMSSPFLPEHYYRFHPELGFEPCAGSSSEQTAVFLGKSLLSLANEELIDEVSLRDAKRLMRLALAPILGQQKINSRQLYYIGPREQQKNEVEVE